MAISLHSFSPYHVAHVLRDSFPFLWDTFSLFNGWCFRLRYGQRLQRICLPSWSYEGVELRVERLNHQWVAPLHAFFERQSEASFTYFRPHEMDQKSLSRLSCDTSFLAYVVVTEQQQVVGYFFMRAFFWGKCYRGYITDEHWRGRGINKKMNVIATEIATTLGLRTFGTISPHNQASLFSAQSVCDVKILRILDSGDWFVEYLPKRKL